MWSFLSNKNHWFGFSFFLSYLALFFFPITVHIFVGMGGEAEREGRRRGREEQVVLFLRLLVY